MKLEIGQTLYSKAGLDKDGNPFLNTHIVTKVGKVYFEVDTDRIRYRIETLQRDSDFNRITLSVSKDDLENEIELSHTYDFIRNKFKGYGKIEITLDQARKIKSILEEK